MSTDGKFKHPPTPPAIPTTTQLVHGNAAPLYMSIIDEDGHATELEAAA